MVWTGAPKERARLAFHPMRRTQATTTKLQVAWLLGCLVSACSFELEPLRTIEQGLGGGSGASTAGGSGGSSAAGGMAGTGGALPPPPGLDGGAGEPNPSPLEDGGPAGVPDAGPPPAPGLLALYTFPLEASNGVYDEESRGDPALRLAAGFPAGLIELDPHGIELMEPSTALVTVTPIVPEMGACQTSGQLTLEAWLSPSRGNPGLVLSANDRNSDDPMVSFSLEQTDGDTRFQARVRTSDDPDAMPLAMLSPIPRDETHHLVFVHAADGTETFYVNGAFAATGNRPGDFSNWSPDHSLSIAADQNDGAIADKWFGSLFHIAIYCSALSEAEVAARFAAGY